MKTFNENQIVTNLMGQAAGDVELDGSYVPSDIRIKGRLQRVCCRGQHDLEHRSTVAELMNNPAGGYSWKLTAAGADWVLSCLSGTYSPAIERRLSKLRTELIVAENAADASAKAA